MSKSLHRLGYGLAAALLAALFLLPGGCNLGNGGAAPAASSDGYLFCFWNVENLFDDKEDNHHSGADQKYDRRFARDPKLLKEKLRNLSKVLLSMNGGKGPDILVAAEVENRNAADLLRKQLNEDLGRKAAPYENLLFIENKAGRNIAPAIITRLPVARDRTRKLVNNLRILEGHIVVNGHDLVVIASHWTSRVTKGSRQGRNKYGDQIYGRYKAMYLANKNVDFLVCGDFNDNPDDEGVVEHLRAVRDPEKLNAPGGPWLFDLSATKWPDEAEKFGTLRYGSKWQLFDQIVVSPGLLDDKGWTCLPKTLQTVRDHMTEPPPKRKGKHVVRPWRFDHEIDGKHGFADHFPVTVRLKVQGR